MNAQGIRRVTSNTWIPAVWTIDHTCLIQSLHKKNVLLPIATLTSLGNRKYNYPTIVLNGFMDYTQDNHPDGCPEGWYVNHNLHQPIPVPCKGTVVMVRKQAVRNNHQDSFREHVEVMPLKDKPLEHPGLYPQFVWLEVPKYSRYHEQTNGLVVHSEITVNVKALASGDVIYEGEPLRKVRGLFLLQWAKRAATVLSCSTPTGVQLGKILYAGFLWETPPSYAYNTLSEVDRALHEFTRELLQAYSRRTQAELS